MTLGSMWTCHYISLVTKPGTLVLITMTSQTCSCPIPLLGKIFLVFPNWRISTYLAIWLDNLAPYTFV